MTRRARIWQVAQMLVLGAGVVGFVLIAGSYGLLVFFAHDAQMPTLPTAKASVEASPQPGGAQP